MSITITYSGGPIMRPRSASVDSYAATAASRTRTHSILDGPPVHTLRAAEPLEGTLTLLFLDEISARDCHSAHMLADVFTIADTARALLNFRYVVPEGETPGVKLEDETRRRWIVTVPYQVVV